MLLYVSAGMPRAGSGWFYNIMHALCVAAGGDDARKIRRRYAYLRWILTEVNCNIHMLSAKRLVPVLLPVALGHTFVIKTHSAPLSLARWLLRRGILRAAYIYRDPRDAALSAYEYGRRIREAGGTNAFTPLHTIEDAIHFMEHYLWVWEQWVQLPQVEVFRYEDLRMDFDRELARLARFMGLPENHPAVDAVRRTFRPGMPAQEHARGLHFHKGEAGRFREVFTWEQQALARERFGPYLARMGYPLE